MGYLRRRLWLFTGECCCYLRRCLLLNILEELMHRTMGPPSMYVHNKLKVEDLLNLDFKSLAEKMEALKAKHNFSRASLI